MKESAKCWVCRGEGRYATGPDTYARCACQDAASEPVNPHNADGTPDERDRAIAFEEGLRQGRAYGAAAERARIVAWLRVRAEALRMMAHPRAPADAVAVDVVAALIEESGPLDVA